MNDVELTVLIVEDDAMVRDWIRLSAQGTAGRRAEAVAEAHNRGLL